MANESGKDVSRSPETTTPAPASRGWAPWEEMERFFEDVFNRGWLRPARWQRPPWDQFAAMEPRLPKVDVVDRDKEIVVRAEVPGIKREDIDVSVTDDTVTIKGETRSETRDEGGDYYRCEITQGAFARTVALPGDVDADKAKGEFKDGILELTLPKIKESRRRRIEVK
ncbi:Hsp20/alpha crystallin family protein [Arhodomonas sp. AD133]|uniref:Hsp20/alpha crystallin family protein n=1 Tax=Arhodomonas sp. AD133 TaxID=3415009 RepID=UPI003EBA98D8